MEHAYTSGLTETEVAWEIETFFHKHGAQSAFSPIVAFNENSSYPHYLSAANHKLRANSLILLDFGARVNGYCADMTRMVFLGKPNTKQKQTYEILQKAQQKALELLQSGERSGAKLDESAREVLIANNLPPYPHSLGHGVGLAIHENPRLSFKKDVKLTPSMVITIEPGVYLNEKFGMRIEDLVYINEKNEIEILSMSKKELIVL